LLSFKELPPVPQVHGPLLNLEIPNLDPGILLWQSCLGIYIIKLPAQCTLTVNDKTSGNVTWQGGENPVFVGCQGRQGDDPPRSRGEIRENLLR
jgi:hypothetical protein